MNSTFALHVDELKYLAKKTNALRIFTTFVDQPHNLCKLSHLNLPKHSLHNLVSSVTNNQGSYV